MILKRIKCEEISKNEKNEGHFWFLQKLVGLFVKSWHIMFFWSLVERMKSHESWAHACIFWANDTVKANDTYLILLSLQGLYCGYNVRFGKSRFPRVWIVWMFSSLNHCVKSCTVFNGSISTHFSLTCHCALDIENDHFENEFGRRLYLGRLIQTFRTRLESVWV